MRENGNSSGPGRVGAAEALKRAVQAFSGPVAAGLVPGCFAFIMATGIVSLAAHFHGIRWLATGLFWLNVGAYLALWALTLVRLACFHERFVSDLRDHSRGAGFLTTSAGTCVLGCQFALLTPWKMMAELLWLSGAGLWLVLIYAVFVSLVVCKSKPALDAGINGSWLLAIVATEAVSVLGSVLAPGASFAVPVLFLSVATYFIGAMLYMFFAALILYRWMFFPLAPEKFTPDYWIVMGALAISTLAGSLLLQATADWDWLRRLEPVLLGSSIFFWVTSAWWVPLLAVMELWKRLLRGVPWKYEPDYWALVFPLGMFAVATFVYSGAAGLSFLKPLAGVFVWVALSAWLVGFGGMLRHLARSVGRARESSRPGQAC